MAFGVIEFLIGITAFFTIVYKYLSWNFDFWKKRGVAGPKPKVPFGNFGDLILQKRSGPEFLTSLYNEYKNEPLVGFFVFGSPRLLVKDINIIKSILIKDFDVFCGRGLTINEDIEPLAAHLFNVDGPRWKTLRHVLSPLFSSGKIKNMFYLINDCADNLERSLRELLKKSDVIDVSEMAARYTTDVIGSCMFGINAGALDQEDNAFREIGTKIFDQNIVVYVKRLLRESSPWLYKLLRITLEGPEPSEFFLKTMRDIIALREKTNDVRNDFVDVMLQLSKKHSPDNFEWNDTVLTAQALFLFAAGFESSSTTISFGLFELAHCQDTQDKLRREILEFEKKNDGKISYENVKDMKYLNMVVNEILRKHSPADALIRAAMQEYKIPGTNITLPVGQHIFISVRAMHMDPDIYPNPDVFDPERFSDEAQQTRDPMTFMPFGDGPKNCIATRFAYYEVKLALIKVIKNFRVLPVLRTMEKDVTKNVSLNKVSILLQTVDGIPLKLELLVS